MWWRDEGAAVWLGWSDILRWMNGCGGGCGRGMEHGGVD